MVIVTAMLGCVFRLHRTGLVMVVRMVMTMPCTMPVMVAAAAALITHVPVQGPGAPFIGQQMIDERV